VSRLAALGIKLNLSRRGERLILAEGYRNPAAILRALARTRARGRRDETISGNAIATSVVMNRSDVHMRIRAVHVRRPGCAGARGTAINRRRNHGGE